MKRFIKECNQLFVVYFIVFMAGKYILASLAKDTLFAQSVLSNSFLGYGLLVAMLASGIAQRFAAQTRQLIEAVLSILLFACSYALLRLDTRLVVTNILFIMSVLAYLVLCVWAWRRS